MSQASGSSVSPAEPSVNGWNGAFLEQEYERYRRSPESVSSDLRSFFQGFELASAGNGVARLGGPGSGTGSSADSALQAAVDHLINAYRRLGHLCAQIDPFGRERPTPKAMMPAYHGFGEEHLEMLFHPGTFGKHHGQHVLTLRELIETLERTYCGTIGVEIDHITDIEERLWLKDRIETEDLNRPVYSGETKLGILEQLYRAELWERFCAKRYPGAKRFSLEGGETLIPMLHRLACSARDDHGVRELVMAMAHRGRLNVLTNMVGKSPQQIFTEFDDAWDEEAEDGGSGDVKYHRGYSSSFRTQGGNEIWIVLASNPSHLEAVGPVALGRCRAKQRLSGDKERSRVIPLLIHGDAAIIGQGVVAETFNLSGLKGYTVGGTVHVVINNLIGFTTGPKDARTSRYCTDFAKQIEAPVFHVNGEDPEAAVHVMQLALDYRMRFKKDVVIDLVCYRRHGHNETDEAAFTQPQLYAEITDKPSVVTTYRQSLVDSGVVSAADADAVADRIEVGLSESFNRARESPVDPTPDPGSKRWVGLTNEWNFDAVHTGVPEETLREIGACFERWPEGFTPHPKVKRLASQRSKAVREGGELDWALAEQLAVGSILLEGTIVRMSGQDSCRGTFSQRHAVYIDTASQDEAVTRYTPLNHVRELGVPGTEKDVGTLDDQHRPRQAKYCIYDSPLSEFAVLGFEYGFSLASPNMLTLWEAQFGDFVNGAQVIIDQFMASAESKWFRWSGITLLLPHGYEGQGPEHSSARIERFLKLCGRNNIQVCVPTTPAQYFHMLRRQVLRKFRKPLVVMTPKSLLRLPACRSTLGELADGWFDEVIDDPMFASAKPKERQGVKRLILCTGKVYYDLAKRREETGRGDVAIVRVEQLYPLRYEVLRDVITSYANAELVWVQEEPQNAGAWGHMHLSFREVLGLDLPYIGRRESPSPAVGSPKKHRDQLDRFLSEAIGPVPTREPSGKPAASSGATSKGGGEPPARTTKKKRGAAA